MTFDRSLPLDENAAAAEAPRVEAAMEVIELDRAVELYLKKHDGPSYLGLRCLRALKGSRVDPHRVAIYRFLIHRYGQLPLEQYVSRLRALRELQTIFERTGSYPSCEPGREGTDEEAYRIALLLSFVLTNHRFEILDSLNEFLKNAHSERPELLCIGFGTGYELKLVSDALPTWRYSAYDVSPQSRLYATDLLSFFGCSADGLRSEWFPLEESELPEAHRERYGKIVLCELLEHLQNPEAALRNMRSALHPSGRLFATMAINLAQEDHVYLYRSSQDARAQISRAELEIEQEFVTPVMTVPFAERDRERVFGKGNYVCVLRRRAES